MSIKLSSQIEGLLFYKGEDVSIKKLATLLSVSENEIENALLEITKSLEGRGLVLIRKDNSVILGISGELSSIIKTIRKNEISKELSKASLETLSIILYKNGISRNQIDYIRGVNSSFILRNLLVRGLVEKVMDKKDNRRVLYRPTFDTLSYMNITSITQLPNYNSVIESLLEVIKENEQND